MGHRHRRSRGCVCDGHGNHRIEKFDREGNFITQWGGFGNGDGQFNFPYGIAVDAKGSVFVVDSGNTRVQQFMPAEEGSERLQEVAEAAAEMEKAQQHPTRSERAATERHAR